MGDDYRLGKCHCCSEEMQVRWKNIYHSGSEGLWVCIDCERKIVEFVQQLKAETFQKKKQQRLKDKLTK